MTFYVHKKINIRLLESFKPKLKIVFFVHCSLSQIVYFVSWAFIPFIKSVEYSDIIIYFGVGY